MSPGCAARVRCADGTRAFVKEVGRELNPITLTLFRREIDVLSLIGPGPLWADLRASYDDGDWVALLIEDVDGGNPDLTDDTQMAALLFATDDLGVVLAAVQAPAATAHEVSDTGLIDAGERFRHWADAWDHLDEIPVDLVPSRLRDDAARCRVLTRTIRDVPCDRLTHGDIRNDNLLRRPAGTVVFVDWGAAAIGPAWSDPLLARLERVDQPWFDDSLASSPALAAVDEDLVTGWLLGLGLFLAWQSTIARDVSLPTLNDFRRTESSRFLTAAARRLGCDRGSGQAPASDLGRAAGR